MSSNSDTDFLHQLASMGNVAPIVSNSATVTLGICRGCQLPLPWVLPIAGQWASPVSCPQCGRWYFTQTHNHCKPELKIDTKVSHSNDPVQQMSRSQSRVSTRVAEIIARLFGEYFVHEERRRTVRYSLSLPLVAVPLDEEGHATSEAFGITILNLSTGGCLLLDSSQSTAQILLLDFTAVGCTGTQLLVKVLRREITESGVKLGCAFLHQPDEALPYED